GAEGGRVLPARLRRLHRAVGAGALPRAAAAQPLRLLDVPRLVKTVVAEPLTAAAFAAFGQVLEAGDGRGSAANQGTALRVDRAAALSSTRTACPPNLAMIRALPQPLPLKLRLLERHPCSSQAFIPLKCL